MLSLGADLGDFVVADMSDRDAGCYQQGPPLCERQADTWWSTDSALPNFAQAFAWSKALADAVGRPVLWWQIPVGNVNQNDTDTHFKDNRVDYLLQHAGDVVANGAVGLAFGAGQDHQTTPSTDGGNLVNRTKAWRRPVARRSAPEFRREPSLRTPRRARSAGDEGYLRCGSPLAISSSPITRPSSRPSSSTARARPGSASTS